MNQKVNPNKYGVMLDRVSAYCGSLVGKRILEVGSDSSGGLAQSLAELGAAEVIGVNPVLNSEKDFGVARLLKEDARSLPYDDGYFDICVSLAAFEHVHGLDEVLIELHRVLKPRGQLFTIFGPIWSGCWGHHLWVYHDGECFNYNNTPLAPYCHLLWEREQFCDTYRQRFGDERLALIADFVYDSPEQNRLFYSDYERIVANAPFRTLFSYGSVNVPFKEGYEPENYADLFRALHDTYPDKNGFEYNSVFWFLEK